MGYIHKGMQGRIADVKDKRGFIREIHVYLNSSDFPNSHILLMPAIGEFEGERVPLTEEIWQKAGECLGYKFKRFPNKNVK